MASKAIFKQAQQHAFDYADNALERNVFPEDKAIENLKEFIEDMPPNKSRAEDVIAKLNKYGSPATVSQTGGRYFGFVNGGVLPVTLAARWLSDFWDQNAALYVISPLVSKLEEISEAWLKDLFGLPDNVVAGFVSGSSLAIFCGLAAGRYRLFQNNHWDINKNGFRGAPKIRIVAGRQAHGTVVKAIALLGFGIDNIEWVETDDQGRIIPAKVPELDATTLLILQAGNVGSGSFDPFREICHKAKQANAWIHIDGAFGLWAAASKRLKHLTLGIDKADSWSVDGHKTLNTPYDNGIVLCNDAEALVQALQVSGSYIAYSEKRDGMLYTPEMSRRARAVELWAALKYLGKDGLDELVFGLHQRAVQIGNELEKEGFQVLNDIVFNQVLAACDNDDMTTQTLRHIQRSGECWAGSTSWAGRTAIRISICSWATTEKDIRRSVRAFVTARQKALKGAKP